MPDEMPPPFRSIAILLWFSIAPSLGLSQSPTVPVVLPPCPECSLAAQSAAAFGPPQLQFLENPKPLTFGDRGSPPLEVLARIVSVRPVMVDILDVASRLKPEGGCQLEPVTVADAKLRPILSQLKFNQVAWLSFLLLEDSRHKFQTFLSGVRLGALPDSGAGVCPNRSGIVVSYHGSIEVLNVYNDGSIYYRDSSLNSFGSQKLSREDLAKLLKSFADSSFDRLPSSPPPTEAIDKNSLTLVCGRYQHVSLTGLETKLAPLLRRLDALKTLATSETHYLLLTSGRNKLTILEWPSRQIHLRQLEINVKLRVGAPPIPGIHDPVPGDFLAQLPRAETSSRPDAPPYTFVAEGGEMYHVVRQCYGKPGCDTFDDLRVTRVLTSAETLGSNPGAWLYSPGGLFWATDTGIQLSQVPPSGRRITKEEYAAHQPLFSKLYETGVGGMGQSFIEDGYMYRGVRICRVDPQAAPSHCLSPPFPIQ